MAEEIGKHQEEPAKSPKEGQQEPEENGLARRLDAVGWGLFLIWLGIVLLAGADTSVALLGIGLIILGVQVARLFFKLRMERFWFVVGLLFLVGSLWQLADTRIPLPPIMLIAAGLALILTHFLRKS